MKKLAVVLAVVVLALAIPSAAFAWDGQVHKGDLAVFVGAGLGYGFTVVPGVEYAFADFKLGFNQDDDIERKFRTPRAIRAFPGRERCFQREQYLGDGDEGNKASL